MNMGPSEACFYGRRRKGKSQTIEEGKRFE
jgi:hypothetical protein